MIKILACITMFIDHIGLLFFPKQILFRIIGRISMPLFAYCIARGIKNTKNVKNYIFRILLIAIVSQIPYMFMINYFNLNICFVWVLTVIFISLCKKLKTKKIYFVYILLVVALLVFVPMDYGLYGFSYVIISYFFFLDNDIIKMYISWSTLHILYLLYNPSSAIMQVFTFPSIIVIFICNKLNLEKVKIKSKFVLWFYPIHIIVLIIIKFILEKM